MIVGAPRGSYPGGLSLDDPGLSATNETGLVYSCPIGPGSCEGVIGDRSVYSGTGVDEDITNGVQTTPIVTLPEFVYSQPISEGRLFDQARELCMVLSDKLTYLVAIFQHLTFCM